MLVNQKFTLLPFASPLREAILMALAQGPIGGMDLLALVSKHFPVTKQGLYKALRELLQDEIILKENRFFSLNKAWLARLNDFKEEGEKNLGLRLPFADGSSKTRKAILFKNAESLDIYWGHLFLTLAEHFPGMPFFFFNHHSLFIHTRPHSELYLFNKAFQKKYKVMITLGVRTAVAKSFKQRFSRENVQIAIDETFSVPKNDHICVIADYFITTRYDAKTMEGIDKLFREAINFNDIDTKKLRSLLNSCLKPKIIITKDAHKAAIWKRRLAKNFAVKKSNL